MFKKKIKNSILISLLITVFCAVAFGGYLTYNYFSFNKEDAKNTIVKFYEMIRNGQNNYDRNLYPDYPKIANVLIVEKNYRIKNIFKNNNGEFEVYTDYLFNQQKSYPISFIVHKIDGEIKIKSSRGISSTFYDDTYEFGIRKGVFFGNESDAEIGVIDKKYNLSNKFKILQNMEISRIQLSIESQVNIQSSNFGIYNGSVSIFNGSDYDLESEDYDCKVNYLDDYENIIESDKVFIFSGIKSGENYNCKIFPSFSLNFTKYSIDFIINETYNLKSKIRKFVIENTTPDL